MDQLLSVPREALYWEYQNITVPATALENIQMGDVCVFDIFADDAGTGPITTFDENHPFNYVRRKGSSAYPNYDGTTTMAGVYCLAPLPGTEDPTLTFGGLSNAAPVVVRAGEKAEFILQGIGLVGAGILSDLGHWAIVSVADFAVVDRMQSGAVPLFCVAQMLQETMSNFDVAWCRFDGLYGFGTTGTSYT